MTCVDHYGLKMLNSKFRLGERKLKLLTNIVVTNNQGLKIVVIDHDMRFLLQRGYIKPHKLAAQHYIVTQIGYGVWRAERAAEIRYNDLVKLYDRLKAKEKSDRQK